jgi:hypothetical protein
MNGRKHLLVACSCLFAWTFIAHVPLGGQVFTGDIVGVVTDQTGAVVPNATITLRNQQTNIKLETTSGNDGTYVFSSLTPATYEVTATAAGFKRFVSPDNILRVGTRLTVDIRMELGDVTTSVEVTAAAALVKPDDITVGQVITERSIVALPLNGRNFLQLAQLSPGVTEIGSAISPSTDWVGRGGVALVVSGLRETDTSYLLDGVETRSPRWGNTGFRPSVEAIQEFNVQRNAFTADQGWGTTVVNTMIRSGTNEYHGSVFHFIRNDALDARNFFDYAPKKPPYKQNQWGVTFGGPIMKDKLFFFFDHEGYRERLSQTYQGKVPTAQELNGVLGTEITDPETGLPFPDNTIPPDRIDPVIKNVIPYYPAPNRPEDPTWNYYRAASRQVNTDQIHAKVDWVLPNNDRMFARFSWLDDKLNQPSLFEGIGQKRPIGSKNATVSHIHIFTPTLVNEFRVGYNRDLNYSVTFGAFGPDLAKEIGLKNTPTNPANFALPLFSPVGWSGVGQGYTATLETIDEIYQINENLSYHRGKHDVKVGADIRYNRLYFTGDFPSNPYFTFDGRFTGNSLADFLLGLPSFFEAGAGNSSSHWRRFNYSFFMQDNFKVHPKLSLYFGLRYEYPDPGTERDDKQGYFDVDQRRILTIRADNVRRTLFIPDRNNFGPRFGFAYSPLSKTVLRGGFGVYYDLIAANESQFRGILMPPNWQVNNYTQDTYPVQYRIQDALPDWEFAVNLSPQTVVPIDRTPYVYMYNMNVQQDFKGVLFEMGYVGSSGHKLNRRFNNNLAPPGTEPLADRRPFSGFGDMLTSQNDGWSNYNGLNMKVEKSFSKGLLLLAAYTWGKHLDIGGPDEYVHHDRSGTLKDLVGPASIDTRHRLVLSYVYELPIGKGKPALTNASGALDKLVSGWQMTGITTFNSGHPLTPNLQWTGWANIGNRWLEPMICTGPLNNSSLKSNIRNNPYLEPYFNIENTVLPAAGTIGNCGRGGLTGPGVNNWDIGLLKNTSITERVNVQFRAEFFNVWNHAQFGGVAVNPLWGGYGRVTWARAPRDIQFGLKVLF